MALYGENLIPKMTSATVPNGVVTASTQINNEAWKAFDGNISAGGWNTQTSTTTGWLAYEFISPVVVDLYVLNGMTDNRAPKNFTFEGWDGSNWIVLDTRINITDYTTPREFSFNNTTAYKKYRINITANNGFATFLGLLELTMHKQLRYVNKVLILNEGGYKKWNNTWQTISTSTPSEQQYIESGMDDLSIIPESAWRELQGQIKLSYFTDNSSTNEITIETETEPYSIYDEFGYDAQGNPLPMEVLYYTDDPDKDSANLEITANYSPLDEIDGDFEVVTWTDEDPAERILSLTALPKPQFIKQIDFNDVYGTITEFLITESFSGAENGVIRYLLSPDRITWKTWTGSTFANIDVSNMSNIVANGIKKSILQSLASSDWNKWIGQKLYLGIYLEEDVRDKTKAHIDSISYSDSVPKESTQISDAKLYILNTVSTINVSFAGSTLSGSIDDEDEGKVQYRVLLNDATYFPADGSFTPLMASPLDISLTIANKDVNIDENNTLRVEFKDYWGTVDYWQRNFVGSYSGLLFTDSTGEYYTTDIGEVLQYLDFGVIIAGQTTIEHEIILKNTYGYSVNDIKLYAKEGSFPSGMRAQFGTNLISFEALDILSIEGVLHDGEEIPFYFRLSTQLGVTPPTVGEFDIVVVANKADEIE